MKDEGLDMIIFSFLNKINEFIQFLPNNNNNQFTIIDISSFLQKLGFQPLNQNDLYKIISKMVENKFIEKMNYQFSFISKNVENYLANNQMEYKKEFLIENKKDNKEPNNNLKENAIRILKKKETECSFVEPEIFEKSIQLINEFDEMGNSPEIMVNVAFFQSNKILNKYYNKNRNILSISNKNQILVKYWIKKFEKKYFNKLFNREYGKDLLYSIKEIGSYKLTNDFRRFVLLLLDSPIKYCFDLNIHLALGLSILLAANFNRIPIENRDICKILKLEPSELITNFFKLMKINIEYDLRKFYKKNPSYVDLINSNIIRIGDHLTFNLDNPSSDDAEILDYTHLKYLDIKISNKEWASKVMDIKNCTFSSNNYIFHRETGLSLKSLVELLMF